MVDIIVRLEQRYEQTAEPECDLIQEAALVIDRLHDELADVRADAALLRTDNKRLTAELETQKAISNQIQGHLEHEESRSYKAEADNERLRAALQSMLTDPPATLDEPDTDAEVIIKMREIARRALELKP